MNPAEAAAVLTILAQIDQRTIGESDARGWADLMADLRGVDVAAVARTWYRTHSERPSPADLRVEVGKLRVERIKAAGDAPLPPEFGLDPDDTIGYRDALREWLRRAADGEALPPAVEQSPLRPRPMQAIANVFPSPPPVRKASA